MGSLTQHATRWYHPPSCVSPWLAGTAHDCPACSQQLHGGCVCLPTAHLACTPDWCSLSGGHTCSPSPAGCTGCLVPDAAPCPCRKQPCRAECRASGGSDELELDLESFDDFLAHRLSGQDLRHLGSGRSYTRGVSSGSLQEADPSQVQPCRCNPC